MEKTIRNKTFTSADEVRELAKKTIINEKLDLMGAQVEYLFVSPAINKTTVGRCIRTGPELNFFSGADYVIEISQDVWDELDDDVKYILLHHELLHIYPVSNDKKGTIEYKLRDHDIQDFDLIIKKYGTDWFKKLKTVMSDTLGADYLNDIISI